MTHPYDHHDDATLVDYALSGNREAFTPLVNRYYQGILRLCIRLLGPITEAEDVAQDTMVQAYLGLASLRDRAHPGAWMYAIAANRCRSILRRPRMESLPESDALNMLVCPQPGPEDLAAERELHRTVLDAIDGLSDINREAVLGFYFDGYSYQELQDILGVPVNKIRSRLSEARRTLRAPLESIAQEFISPKPSVKEIMMDTTDQIRIEIEQVMHKVTANEGDIIFRAIDKEQYVILKLSLEECETIDAALHTGGETTPVAHNLAFKVLNLMGGQLERVTIDQLVGAQCIARLTISGGNKTYTLDVRIGEAIALAILCKTPMYVTNRTIDAIGISLDVKRKALSNHEAPIRSMASRRYDELLDYVWQFILGMKSGKVDEQAFTMLKNESWEELLPSRKVTWEEQKRTAVKISCRHLPETPNYQNDDVWLVVPDDLWESLTGIVGGIKDRNLSRQPVSVKADPLLSDDVSGKIDKIMSHAFQDLETLGVRTMALMSRNGKMVGGYSIYGPEEAETLGINAIRIRRIIEYRQRLESCQGTGGWIYNRGNLWFHAGLHPYEEGVDYYTDGPGLINGHWGLTHTGVTEAANHAKVDRRIRRMVKELKEVLPDYSDYYQEPEIGVD